MPNPTLTRRSLLAGVAASAGLAAAGCAPDDGQGSDRSTGVGPVAPPSYVPFDQVRPDKPGTAEGVSPMFVNYPNPPVARQGYPLSGIEPFTALVQGGSPKVPLKDNKCYDAWTASLGATFDLALARPYLPKFQVTMASGDIPDLCQIVPVAELPKLLEQDFTDLTDILSGDNVAEYPGLANIPTETWQIGTLNGRLWGIAQPRPPAGNVLNVRGDVLAERGITEVPPLRDGKDFLEFCRDVTDADKGLFALGADPMLWILPAVLSMFEAPNVWRETGGTFVHENETEQMEAALSQCRNLVKAGVLHPESFSNPTKNGLWYSSGVTAMLFQSFVGWGAHARKYPEWKVHNVELPLWEGGGPAPIRKSVAGYGAFVAIKKASEDRVRQMLRVCDYIASPFGTTQMLEVFYGVEGYSYKMKDGNPVMIPKGPGTVPGLKYAGGNRNAVVYGQGDAETAHAQYAFLERALPTGVRNDATGLWSETAATKAATLAREQADVQRDLMLGNKPMTAWRDFVKRWKAQVGTAMANEYAEAAKAAGR